MKLIKENENGKVYEGGELKIFYRKKNSISGDNNINKHERIYLIRGEIELTIKSKTEKITAPAEFEIPENTYHKFLAMTDIIFILMKN